MDKHILLRHVLSLTVLCVVASAAFAQQPHTPLTPALTPPAPAHTPPTPALTPPAPASQPAGQTFAPATQSLETDATLVFKVNRPSSRLEMTVHTSRIFTMEQKITQAQVNNPEVLGLTVLSPNQIQVSAKATGVTQVNLWGDDQKLHTVNVLVFGDAQELETILRITFPNAVLKVMPVAQSVLISGFVDKPEHIAKIVQVAEEYYPKVINNMTVGGVQQVLLHVKVMEVSRTKLRRLGFDFAKVTGGNVVTSGVSGLLSNAIDTSESLVPSLAANSATGAGTFLFGIVNGNNAFYGVLDALRQDDLLKIRAEPTLTAVSGQEAIFNSGGEIPIPVPQSLGTVSIEWKDYGTMIRFIPIVLGNGKIRMEVRPEVSELDDARSLTIEGTTVPGILTRNASTTVEMQAGQTLAIAGLVQSRSEAHFSGLPWISDVPYLGVLFRQVKEESNELETLILVTPELIEPLDANEVPPCGPGTMTTTPSDWELFMKGYLEVPKCCPAPNGGNAGCPNEPGAPPPADGMILGPAEHVPSPPPTKATSQTTSVPYSRHTSPKPSPTAAAPAAESAQNPPGFIGSVGYDVVK